MSIFFVFLAMIFCHIVDDYYLQGWLASAKQKSYWEQNAPDELYKNDYKMALAMHAMSWAFMIMLPIAIYFKFDIGIPYVLLWAFNAACHSYIDDAKANRKTINLITDQSLHMIQIVFTLFLYFIVLQ